MAQTVLVCVKELNTRSRVQISTSLDQFHSYGIHVQFTILRAIYSRERRLRVAASRSPAISTAAAAMHVSHMYVYISARTCRYMPSAYAEPRHEAIASLEPMHGPCAASTAARSRPEHEVAAQPRR